jgi:phage tail sheath protein FI
MPEYLAPDVYVEEVDTGNKPIEGLSTSTAGMIGVTERGPVNVPILITSYGEYVRWFGERLNRAQFGDHCYLPHAVEGFFINGGKRVYITRVLDLNGATRAIFDLHDRGDQATLPPATTWLLRSASELTGIGASPLYVLNVNNPVPNTGTLVNNNRVRIGSGSETEYRVVDTVVASASATHVALNFALARRHDAGVANSARHIPRTLIPLAGASLSLSQPAEAGDQTITVEGSIAAAISALAVDQILEIGSQFGSEHRFVRQITIVDPTHAQLLLDSPLIMNHSAVPPNPEPVIPLDSTVAPVAGGSKQLDIHAAAGDRVIFVQNRAPAFTNREELVVLDNASPTIREVRRVGSLNLLSLSTGAYGGYAANTVVQDVNLSDDATVSAKSLTADAASGSTVIALDNRVNLMVDDVIRVGVAPNQEYVTIAALPNPSPARAAPNQGNVVLTHPLNRTHARTAEVRRQTPLRADDASVPSKSTTGAVNTGDAALPLDNRTNLNVGDVIRINAGANTEYAAIVGLPNRGAAPDPGNVIIAHPVVRAHASGTQVQRQAITLVRTDRPATVLALDVSGSQTFLPITDGGPAAPASNRYVNNDVIRITTGFGDVFYHQLSRDTDMLDARPVSLTVPLTRAHQAGAAVVERGQLLNVQALDWGDWGNRLRISVQDEPAGMASRTSVGNVIDANHIRLASAANIEPGTIIEVFNPADGAAIGDLLKVTEVNRASNFTIKLDGAGISAAQSAPGLAVRSREFSLTVYLFRQPDLAMPSRDETILDTEVFRYLSMDPRHSRYVQDIVGASNGPLRLSDRRPEGESRYIRVTDINPSTDIRLGPETLVDILPDGRRRPARHPLGDVIRGSDSLVTLTDNGYIGQDDPNPENRTGLHSLRNIEEISILACPGRTTKEIQTALINHCELMRYRFAVLDGPRPPQDTLSDVQTQRQQFDTKYAALYHPWLLIPDPYPLNVTPVPDYPIPPSGHMLGVYARTDIERGVHKAPANEVVRGIIGLQRILNKEQHDILNPYPVNINVIRDFRDNNRGIRVYGGRVITSDSDWKYVNVRRLLIFIEASIDRGLQWVVFEPNNEALWARVRRSISNFLTLVWRNGGLEGTKVEEAYFVKCDRTTMTQTDLDSGRLICVAGVAAIKPAEFVIVRIGLWTAHAEE